MTKKIVFQSLVLSLVLLGTSVAQADSTTTPVKGAMASSTPKARIENHLSVISHRFQDAIDRLTNVAAKITTKIEKIKAGGGNVTEAEKFVTDAKSSLDKAKTALTTLEASVKQAITTSSTQNKQELRKTVNNLLKSTKVIKDHLQDARRLLSKAIGSLRGMSKVRPATTTPTI